MRDYELIREHISKYFDVGGFQTTTEGSFFVVNDYDYDKFSSLIKDLDIIRLYSIYGKMMMEVIE